jgi:hypothetical protein
MLHVVGLFSLFAWICFFVNRCDLHDNYETLTIYSYELVMNVHMIFQQLNESHRDQLEVGVCAIEEEEEKQGERGPLQSGLGGSRA